jgi:omega-6 fatty acid desaturase (delta-12 desaturase)
VRYRIGAPIPGPGKASRWVWLLAVTGVIGLAGEVMFYPLVRAGKSVPGLAGLLFSFEWRVDPSLGLDAIWSVPARTLFGQASLWMAPVYAAASLLVVRPLWILLRGKPAPVRAAAYGIGIALLEAAAGRVAEGALGVALWTYVDDGAVLGGTTSWRIVPLWMLVGLVAERVVREAEHPAVLAALRRRLRRRLPPLPPPLANPPTVQEAAAAIPAGCRTIDEARALRALGASATVSVALAAAVLALDAALLPHVPSLAARALLLAPAWWLLGQAVVGLFVIGHDCGHGAFSPRPWLNAVVGQLCLGLVGLSFEGWRLSHTFHHARPNVKGVDPDWAEGQLTLPEWRAASPLRRLYVRAGWAGPGGLLAGFFVGVIRKDFLPWAGTRLPRASMRTGRILAGTLLGLGEPVLIGVALHAVGGTSALVLALVLPVLSGAAAGAMLTFLHHTRRGATVIDEWEPTPGRAQIDSTFEVRFPRWLEWLWRDIALHLPHHLAPRIPWYHLREASAAVHARFPGRLHPQVRFSPSLLSQAWAAPLLVAERGSPPDRGAAP